MTSVAAHGIVGHYGHERLEDAVLAALRAEARDPDRVEPEDLAPLDHFHVRGAAATRDLLRLLPITPDQHVLDVGGGIGGAARLLAREVGCRVTVLDLTDSYVGLGARLTALTGLDGHVRFQVGTALDLPFPPAAFDHAITQHMSMNVADKNRLYAEIARVLRPGGWLGIHDIVAGARRPLHFPVPWSREPALSFLCRQQALRRLLREVGLEEQVWVDDTGRSRRWLLDAIAAPPARRALGLHLLVDGFDVMFRNLARNVAEGRLELVLAAARKSAP